MTSSSGGWYRSIKNYYHYWDDYIADGSDSWSICTIAIMRRKNIKLHKLETIQREPICLACLALVQSDQALQIAEPLLINSKRFASDRRCAEPGCAERGGAYVPATAEQEEKPHYCIKHNPLIRIAMMEECGKS